MIYISNNYICLIRTAKRYFFLCHAVAIYLFRQNLMKTLFLHMEREGSLAGINQYWGNRSSSVVNAGMCWVKYLNNF